MIVPSSNQELLATQIPSKPPPTTSAANQTTGSKAKSPNQTARNSTKSAGGVKLIEASTTATNCTTTEGVYIPDWKVFTSVTLTGIQREGLVGKPLL